MSGLSAEQLEMRKLGVGGSEIAAVVGMNPHAGPLDVWRAKVEGHVLEDTPHMERGRFLERGIADWFAYRTGAQLSETGTLVHPKHAIVRATPDFLATTDAGTIDLSIKCPGPRTWRDWGEQGTDAAPLHHVLQAQWELSILRAQDIHRTDIAAPLDGDLSVFHVLSDHELQEMLIEQAERFWTDYVVTGRPPPPDASDGCSEWLKVRYPAETAPLLEASPEADAWARKLAEAKRLKKEWATKEAEAGNFLRALLGPAQGIHGEGWKLSWKANKPSVDVDWEAIAKEAGVPEELVQKYTRLKPGPRVLRLTGFKETE